MIENYVRTYKSKNKYIYEPTLECKRRADTLLKWSEDLKLPSYFFHYRNGGHVEALHQHLQNRHFFRIDLKNFFYSIARNRVARVLRESGFRNARQYAEWSSVKNPYLGGPNYVLPIGFKQSPLLASLVLWRSPVASAIEDALHRDVLVSVYFDDLIGSANDEAELRITYDGILEACLQANLTANEGKLIPPAQAIMAFNCHLSHGRAEVTDERIQEFINENRGSIAEDSFLDYCIRVAGKNSRRTPPIDDGRTPMTAC
ncbi:hypothetical protein ABIF86_008283 [Bradyrhizobium japonicum]